MEVYTLDNLLRRQQVIDRFESLIWKEKYADIGDFELSIQSTQQNRAIFMEGTRLALNRSRRIMTVETIEDKEDSEGRMLLNVKGRSLESLLETRINRKLNLTTGGIVPEKQTLTGTPGYLARWVFSTYCQNNTDIPADNIPFLVPGSLYAADTIAEPTTEITMEFDIGSVLTILKEICSAYGLGFRLYRGPDTQKLYFNVYAGSDRTSTQSTLTPVIFSPDLENLSNITLIKTMEKLANVAYVTAKNGSAIVYANGATTATTGFDRRVIHVKSDAEDLAGPELQKKLTDLGKQELAQRTAISAIDGEVPQFGRFVYEQDYNLGDLIEIRNDYGATHRMRITEQIFVDDAEGERSYPTLERELFVEPGVWLSWDASGTWETAVGTWAEQ